MSPRPLMLLRLLVRWTGRALAALAVIAVTLWGALALWFQLPTPELTIIVITLWSVLGLLALLTPFMARAHRKRLALLAGWLIAAVALLLWWQSITPAAERDWAADVARLPQAEVQGNQVTLHNVRNFDWQTQERFIERWETRHYDLSQITSTDLIVSYWMGPAIAHTLVSFGFRDGQHLVFSVEIRRERDESFSTLGGFFKQFELALIAADEHDIVRTRSNVRGEEVYLYRVALPSEAARALFLSYLHEAESLQQQPAFYNTLFSNCTTLVFDMVKRIIPGLPLDYRLLLSGYLPDYIHDLDALATSRDMAELKQRGHINSRAIAADREAPANDFSRLIRRGVPAPDGHFPESDTVDRPAHQVQ